MLVTEKRGAAKRGGTLIPTRWACFMCNMCTVLPSLLESVCKTSLLTMKHANREFVNFHLSSLLLSRLIEVPCSNGSR
jgi:hypothetical protein